MSVGEAIEPGLGRQAGDPAGVDPTTPAAGPGSRLAGRVLVVLAALVIVPAGLIATRGSFDGLYGQDAFAYYDYAVGPVRESLPRLAPLPPFFWPPGYPLLVALVSLILGPTPLAGQLVSLAAAGLVPVGTALLAQELGAPHYTAGTGRPSGGQRVALLAGFAAALTPQLWQSGIVVMADTTGLSAATWGIWALARYGRTGRPGWLWLAAAGLAFATETRWIYGLVSVPCAVYALVVLLRAGFWTAVRQALPAAVVAGIVLLPVLVPVLGSAAPATGEAVPFAGNFQIYRWHPALALQREFVTADGLLQYPWPNGLYYLLAPAHRFYLTPGLAVFAVLGVWILVRRAVAVPLFLVLGWAAIVYAFHAGAPWQNFRFTLAYLPPLAILAAVGAVALASSGGRWVGRAVAVVLLAGFAFQAVWGVELTRAFIAQKAGHLAITDWVLSQVPPNGRVLTFGLTLTLRHYTSLDVLELWELTPVDLADMIASDRPAYLLLDVAGVERQWQGRSPSENYIWLRDGPGLTPLGEMDGYTLFRIGAATP